MPLHSWNAWQMFLALKQTADISEQLVAAKRAIDLGTAVFGERDDRIPALMSNYGVILYESGQKKSAKDVLADALELAEHIQKTGKTGIKTGDRPRLKEKPEPKNR